MVRSGWFGQGEKGLSSGWRGRRKEPFSHALHRRDTSVSAHGPKSGMIGYRTKTVRDERRAVIVLL
ncbi:hypothetical protein IMCC21224_137 [Puniceibacterium sp. IMCC21224]|nr:hypothetical protein IMCC21224_137 [Puniceibacterium sp. IMCC21224]